jgi:hypothetical protein
MGLAEKHFKVVSGEFEKEEDPETGDEWLILAIAAQRQREDVLTSYDQYTAECITLIPWPQCQFIRLAFRLV